MLLCWRTISLTVIVRPELTHTVCGLARTKLHIRCGEISFFRFENLAAAGVVHTRVDRHKLHERNIIWKIGTANMASQRY